MNLISKFISLSAPETYRIRERGEFDAELANGLDGVGRSEERDGGGNLDAPDHTKNPYKVRVTGPGPGSSTTLPFTDDDAIGQSFRSFRVEQP